MAQCGIEASREAVRCWATKFGPLIAANLRRRGSTPTRRWRLDEMVLKGSCQANGNLSPALTITARGVEVSYETIGCWVRKFGRQYAQNVRRSRPAPTARWHLDEMVCKIGGRRMWLWRAVFNLQPHLIQRSTLRVFRAEAHRTWAAATAAA